MPVPEPPPTTSYKIDYKTDECYTINEVSEKFGISYSTLYKAIRRESIPKKQIGKTVYVPKEQINKLFKP